MRTVPEHYNRITSALATMPKPAIAAVGGTCVGAGLGFALACDLRLAASGVRFATAFSGIGFGGDSGLSATLAHAVGASRATDLLMLGDTFTAESARDWGLVREVVAAEDLDDKALALARRLANGPTAAYAEIKIAVALGTVSPLSTVLEHEGGRPVTPCRHGGPPQRRRGLPGQGEAHVHGALTSAGRLRGGEDRVDRRLGVDTMERGSRRPR